LWFVRAGDLEQRDPQARVWVSTESKIRIPSAERPVPPPPTVPGLPPLVAFTGLLLVPYVDATRCGPGNRDVRCRGRLAYSLRATGMVAFRPDAGARPTSKAA
jgi:hypothetical protein